VRREPHATLRGRGLGPHPAPCTPTTRAPAGAQTNSVSLLTLRQPAGLYLRHEAEAARPMTIPNCAMQPATCLPLPKPHRAGSLQDRAVPLHVARVTGNMRWACRAARLPLQPQAPGREGGAPG
jgi:hypothetical protein